jgi:hypothetical protein
MRPGPPEDRQGSALLQYLDRFYDYARDEDQVCWLGYPALVIDAWDTDLVTVEAKVPARYAVLYENGEQAFPEAALREAGATVKELKSLHAGRLTGKPMEAAFGRQRFRVAGLPSDRPVPVTWRVSITEFIGERHAALFKGLRRYGPDEDLRILSRRG